jgi:hypothetical protein
MNLHRAWPPKTVIGSRFCENCIIELCWPNSGFMMPIKIHTLIWISIALCLTAIPSQAEPGDPLAPDKEEFDDLASDVHVLNASLAIRTGHTEQALDEVSRSIAVHPSKPSLYLLRAACYVFLKQLDKALVAVGTGSSCMRFICVTMTRCHA